jgi:hypothetical protein
MEWSVPHPIFYSIPGFVEVKRKGSIEYSSKAHARSNMVAKKVGASGYASIIHKTYVEFCTLATGFHNYIAQMIQMMWIKFKTKKES